MVDQYKRGKQRVKPLGIVRQVDDLGRLVIPAELRRTMGIGSGQPMEMFATDHGVFIRRYEPGKPAPAGGKIEGVEL